MGAACSSGDAQPSSKKERKSKKDKPTSPSMTPTTSNLKKGKQTSPSMTPTTSNLKKSKQAKKEKGSPNSPVAAPVQRGSPLVAHPLLPPSQAPPQQPQPSPPQIVVEQGAGGANLKLNEDSFSDDDGPRRCSMRDNTTLKQASEALQLKAAQQLLSGQSGSKQPAHPHSRAGVKKHNAENDLWVIVRGKIFDVTSFVADHPGGSWALVNLAGSDASKEFLSNHSDEQSAWRMLMRFYVADVQD